MAPRGMSKEDKRIKMMEIFHDSAEFFSFKEIEKIAPIQQSVKDVIEELKSDGLLVCEKIGTGVYYWSFPSAAGAQKQGAADKMRAEVEEINAKIAEVESGIAAAAVGREDTAQRRSLLSQLAEETAKAEEMRAQLDAYGAADPLKYEKKRGAAEVAKSAAARWTDNILICFAILKNMGAEEDNLREMFSLPENWDNLELVK